MPAAIPSTKIPTLPAFPPRLFVVTGWLPVPIVSFSSIAPAFCQILLSVPYRCRIIVMNPPPFVTVRREKFMIISQVITVHASAGHELRGGLHCITK